MLIAVHRLFLQFPTLPSIHHILGHQDRHSALEYLSLASQLNVEADSLATHELNEFAITKPNVPFDPVSLALFQIDDRTATHAFS
jgi:hypothetical protein